MPTQILAYRNKIRSMKKNMRKDKNKISPNAKIVFPSIVFRKDKVGIEKRCNDVNTRLRIVPSKRLFRLKEIALK